MSEGPRAGAPGAFLGGAAPRRRAPEQLNRTGWGKRIALLLALVFGVIYAIPNLYPPDKLKCRAITTATSPTAFPPGGGGAAPVRGLRRGPGGPRRSGAGEFRRDPGRPRGAPAL